MRTRRVAFYLSGHGFGHAARSCEVIGALARLLEARGEAAAFHVCSTVPAWFFADSLDAPFTLRPAGLDVGVVQQDSLTLDPGATLRAYARLLEARPGAEREELAFLARERIELVYGDIPPAVFALARRAGIPCVGLGNFGWDWIYEPYAAAEPDLGFVLESIRADYRQADLLLRLPFSAGMDVFPRVRDIGLVARRSALDPGQARARLGLPASGPVMLLSFGGLGLRPDFFAALPPGVTAVCSEALAFRAGAGGAAVRNVPREELRGLGLGYPDLVRASDVVATKPGYGILSECLANGVPMLYTSRGDFREYPVLVEAIERLLPASRFIDPGALARGELQKPLEEILAARAAAAGVFSPPACDGAREAAGSLLKFLP